MTPTEYANCLRHCADVIERLGVVPLLNEVPRFQIEPDDFIRVFAGEQVKRSEHNGMEHLLGNRDGVEFTTVRRIAIAPSDVLTIPKEAA